MVLIQVGSILLVTGCNSASLSGSLLGGSGSSDAKTTNSVTLTCPELTGTAWSPQVLNASSSNHADSTVVSVTQTTTTATGPVTGLSQAAPASREISVSIDMTQDLGAGGSLSLIAQTTSYPSGLSGSAFPYLVSLSDGVNELVNLARAGSGGDCAASGYYTCSAGTCTPNASCVINWPSAFLDRIHWEQHQSPNNSAKNSPSINIFPTCNWTGGTNQSKTDPSCGFNASLFPASPSPQRLRFGTTYVAKYVLLADSYSTLSGYTAGFSVTVVKKKDTRSAVGGAMDINLILVGKKNIQDSRTAKGQQNLNTLASMIVDYYQQPNVNLKTGTVKSYEFPCASGGEAYADLGISELGDLLASSGTLLPAGSGATSLNLFIVSSIHDDSPNADDNLTILGVDGAIGGPVVNGTRVSGMVMSSFDELATYNSNCSSGVAVCPISQVDEGFFGLATTGAHEMGHYFGLNHLGESGGTVHDAVRDTPVCTKTIGTAPNNYLDISSCRTDTNILPGTSSSCLSSCSPYLNGSFCPAALACQFNYLMWWTVINFYEGTGASDGTLFSPNQGGVIRYHPLVQ